MCHSSDAAASEKIPHGSDVQTDLKNKERTPEAKCDMRGEYFMKRKTMDNMLIREQDVLEEINSKGLSEKIKPSVGVGVRLAWAM